MIVVLLLIMFATMVDGVTALAGAFLAGIIVDLWNADRIGISSVIFVTVAFILNLYKRKFNPEHLIFLIPFTLAAVTAILFIRSNLSLERGMLKDRLLEAGTGIIILWVGMRLWQKCFTPDGRSV